MGLIARAMPACSTPMGPLRHQSQGSACANEPARFPAFLCRSSPTACRSRCWWPSTGSSSTRSMTACSSALPSSWWAGRMGRHIGNTSAHTCARWQGRAPCACHQRRHPSTSRRRTTRRTTATSATRFGYTSPGADGAGRKARAEAPGQTAAAALLGSHARLLTSFWWPLSCRRPRSKRKCWEVTQILHRARVFDADAAAREAAKQERLHSHPGGTAPSFAASAVLNN